MKVVVITGSTRGIGFGLADAFLDLGHAVVLSGRSMESVQAAKSQLAQKHGEERMLDLQCDVRKPGDLQDHWNDSVEKFGRVDIWINNAGRANALMAFRKIHREEMSAVIETNLLGAMYGCQVALNGMLDQGFGAIYNLEGHGSSGRKQPGLTLYGTSKAGLTYLTDALVEEVEGTPVIIGALRPGMVWTRLLSDQFKDRPEELEQNKRILNILVDRVDTVTPWLAEKILSNEKNGARIRWYSRRKLAGRFLSAPFNPRAEVEDLA